MAKILVVDDDVEFGKAFSKLLSGEGHETSVALDTSEGLSLLKKESFDLVFADLSLPGENGIALLQNVKRDLPGLPVVIITAFGDWDTYAAAIEKGAGKFINKPVKKEEVLQVIRDILG
ncbi:MAG: response regulator [Candidatus Omnitrophota bacterium]|nr:response regulator [Candidatus Omnitrophota bacterium]